MRPPRMRSAGLLAAVAAAAVLAASPARADTVTDWNVNATDALITTAGQAPTVSTIHLAMVHGAVFDAVNSIDRGYEPYLVRVPARSWYSQDAAAAAAAYRVLTDIVPAQQSALAARYAASLAAIPDGSAKQGGIAVGEAAAWAMIAARTEDGRFGPYRFPVGADARQLATRPAGLRERPERVGQGRRPVPGQGSRAVPLARPLRPRQPQVRARVRGGQVARFGHEQRCAAAIRRPRPASGPRVR